MAVTSEVPIASSVANGVTTVFPHSFTVLDDGDLVVTGTVSNVTTTYTLGVDYTVSGVGSPSGSVTFVTPPASGTIVTRYRDIALTRETDYQDNGDLLADVLNADMDRLVFMLQDIFNGGKVVPTCVRAPNGETLNALPSALARAGYFLGFDGSGQPTLLSATAGTAAALSADLASASDAIKGDALIGVKRTETGAAAKTLHAWIQSQPLNIKDFGAVGDGVTDDTAAIQAAIDAAYAGGVGAANSIFVPAGNFLCGQVTTYPYTTIIGTGRQTSNFKCKSGTTGKWWSDRGNGAQKLTLYGLAWYGNNETGLTHICEFGDTGVQFGTEGVMRDLWMRDAPNAYGLFVDGNVGFINTITLQSVKYGIKTLGNANQVQNVVAVQCTNTAADFSGAFVRGLEIEATSSGALPLRLNGDSTAKDVVISTTTGYTFSHLIEVDTTNYITEWAVENVQLLGTGYTISNGVMRIGTTNYYGGTTPTAFSGASYTGLLSLHQNVFELALQRMQSFNVRIFNNGGTLQHRIGASGNSSLATNLASKINGASTTLTNSPTGADASTAFAAGAKVGGSTPSFLILDTADQTGNDAILQANIIYNSSTTDLIVWPQRQSINVNGVTRTRICLQLYNATSGVAYALSSLPSGAIVEISVLAFIA